MEIVLAIAIGVLTACGVWLLLRPRTYQVIMGLCLLGYGVNLFIFSTGRLALDSAEQALQLEDALQRLANSDARAAQVVELAWFAGLSQDQISETLGVARSTIARDWRFARAFLKDQLGQ